MGNETKTRVLTIRLDPTLGMLCDRVAVERGAADLSDYIRGLLIADAIALGHVLVGIEVPSWVVGTVLDVQGKVPASDELRRIKTQTKRYG
jgi:hypothetical protein